MARSSTPIPNRTRRTAEERRIDVLRAAIVEFSTHGLHGGSTETIAEMAGISQPYVLRLFKTKKALFLAALAQVSASILSTWKHGLETWEQQRDPAISPTAAARLQAIGMAYFELVASVDELRLALQAYASAEDDDVRRQVHASLDELFTWVREATSASDEDIRRFFATGMMLTVAASIHAADVADSQAWARAYLLRPI